MYIIYKIEVLVMSLHLRSVAPQINRVRITIIYMLTVKLEFTDKKYTPMLPPRNRIDNLLMQSV